AKGARAMPLRPTTKHFIRHYVEMVVVMFVGMGVLTLPARWVVDAVGTSYTEAPRLMFLSMAVTLTLPMVAWMRFRVHGWQPTTEMSGSMILPPLAVLGLLGAGIVDDTGV